MLTIDKIKELSLTGDDIILLRSVIRQLLEERTDSIPLSKVREFLAEVEGNAYKTNDRKASSHVDDHYSITKRCIKQLALKHFGIEGGKG